MCPCVCPCVRYAWPEFSTDFNEIRNMGTSHLEKGQDDVFTWKIRPPPPQIRLNLAQSNRNAFVSSVFDFTLVSLHLTVISPAGLLLENPLSEPLATPILHRQRTNAEYSRPATTNSTRPTQHFVRMRQNISCLVSIRSSQCEGGWNAWWLVTTCDNGW